MSMLSFVIRYLWIRYGMWSVCGVGVVDGYGCVSKSVSAFSIALVVVVVQSCISTSIAIRLSGVGPLFLGRRSPWARAP